MADIRDFLVALIDTARDAIIGITPELCIASWNAGAERLYGYAAGDCLGRPVSMLAPADDPAWNSSRIARMIRDGLPRSLETTHTRADGSPVTVSLTLSDVIDAQGATIGCSMMAHDITARLDDLRELKNRERRYRGLIESQVDLIVRVTPDGRFTFANAHYCDTFGIALDDLIDRTFIPLVHEDDLPRTLEAMKGLEKPPYRIYVEQRAMTVHGWRWFAWEDYAIRDEDGRTIEIQGIGRDITDRKEIERELIESRRKYQRVFDKAHDIIALIDGSTGVVVEINDRVGQLTGFGAGEIAGTSVMTLPFLVDESKQRVGANFKKRIAGENPPPYEIEITTRTGVHLVGEVNATLVRFGDDTVYDLIIIRDVTDRKATEHRQTDLVNQLTSKTNELNTIIESIGEAIVCTDAHRIITTANRAFTDLTGIAHADAIGRRCPEVMTCHDDGGEVSCEEECRLAATIQTGATSVQRSTITRTDGASITVQAVNSPLRDAHGDIIGAVTALRDISREAAVERMRNDFVTTISHALRTPLTSILGYTDLMLEGDTGEITATQREFLTMVSSNAAQLKDLVSDLLDVQTLEAGTVTAHMVVVSLSDIARETASSLDGVADLKGIRIDRDIQEGVMVTAERNHMTIILANLLTNAIKFSTTEPVCIALRMASGHVTIAVTDKGIGIAPREKKLIFTKFYRGDNDHTRSVAGTGLGLYYVKTLVDLYKGSVAVRSTKGNGTTITVRLPISEPGIGAPADGDEYETIS